MITGPVLSWIFFAYTPGMDLTATQNAVQNLFLNYTFALIAVLGLLLGVYFIGVHHKKNTRSGFFGIFILTVSIVLLELDIFWWAGIDYSPKIPLFKALSFAWGPSLYFYVQNKNIGHKG